VLSISLYIFVFLICNKFLFQEKWVEVLNDEGKHYTDMNYVRQVIESHNAQIIGSGQVISNVVLTVKLFSPDVPDLSLVDLHGLIDVNH